MIDAIAIVAVAFVFGGITFFSFVIAPLAFAELGVETAGRLVRRVFPRYYLVTAAASAAAALALAAGQILSAAAMALVCLGSVVARQGLMPAINASRDRASAGDPLAGRRFDRLHRVSVIINGVQLLITLAVLVRLA